MGPWWVVDNEDKRRGRLNVISHLLSQIPYDREPAQDVKLPARQKPGDYQPSNRPVRHIPSVF